MAFEKQAIAERELKDRVREILGYAERVLSGKPTSLASHARNHGINPSFSLPDPKFIADDDRHEDDELHTLLLHQALDARLGRILSRYKTNSQKTKKIALKHYMHLPIVYDTFNNGQPNCDEYDSSLIKK